MGKKAHQRKIRERYAEREPGPVLSSLSGAIVVDANDKRAGSFGPALAQDIILKYEWLGSLGLMTKNTYVLMLGGDMLGVVSFGRGTGEASQNICGKPFDGLAICLERGACVHYAPKNSASFLIRRATKLMWLDHGWQVFYAYADPQAGEIGTVYQAVGWEYIGQGVGHGGRDRWYFKNPANGRWITSKSFYHRGLKKAPALAEGWKFEERPAKHKYVWFEGSKSQKKYLRRLAQARYPFLPYPKRT